MLSNEVLQTFEFHKNIVIHIAQKTKFCVEDFFSQCDQIRKAMGNWSHLLKKSLLENFNFFAVPRLSLKLYYEAELGSNMFIFETY